MNHTMSSANQGIIWHPYFVTVQSLKKYAPRSTFQYLTFHIMCVYFLRFFCLSSAIMKKKNKFLHFLNNMHYVYQAEYVKFPSTQFLILQCQENLSSKQLVHLLPWWWITYTGEGSLSKELPKGNCQANRQGGGHKYKQVKCVLLTTGLQKVRPQKMWPLLVITFVQSFDWQSLHNHRKVVILHKKVLHE